MPPTNVASELFSSSDIPCAVIGEDNLLVVCLRKLRNAGFFIECVFSNTLEVQTYCEDAKIPNYKRNANIEEILEDKKIDYLFSISNPRILTENVLKIPQVMTINYHDSPLPAYAGVHATSWALINGETTHGISWHIVETGIDTGHILQSQKVEITPGDTAFTLNLKCQEAAINSFDVLLREIGLNDVKPKPQNVTKRSYFGLYALPPNMGILNFQNETTTVYNLARSLDFGQHDNALGAPRVKTSTGEFLLVQNAVIAGQQRSECSPGMILGTVENQILVSTLDNPIQISVVYLDGSEIPPDTFEKHGIRKGGSLPCATMESTPELVNIRKKETFWKLRLLKYDPTMFFMQHMYTAPLDAEEMSNNSILTETINIPFSPSFGDTEIDKYRYLSSAFIAFLGRICCTSEVSVGLVADKDGIPSEVNELYADILPANFLLNLDQDVATALSAISDELSRYQTSGTYLKDILYRYPKLRDRSVHHNIVLNRSMIERAENKTILKKCKVLVDFNSLHGNQLYLTYERSSASDATNIVDVAKHFPVFLKYLQQQTTKSLAEVSFVNGEYIERLYPTQNHGGNCAPRTRVYSLFTDVCERLPSKQALKTTNSSITYQTLKKEVDGLADLVLSVSGKSQQNVIGIHLPGSFSYVASILAVLKCNLIFLPLPENIPPERFAFIVKDANVQTVITFPGNLNCDKFKKISTYRITTSTGEQETIVIAQNTRDENDNIHTSFPLSSTNEENHHELDRAYVMYTSGSTGKPKGVLLKESAMINMAQSQIKLWDMNEEDIVAQFASIGFDASISEIFTSLLSGATLSIFQEHEKLGQEFVNAINHMRVTTITLPPSVLAIYSPEVLRSLTKVVTAGEVCTFATAHKWTSDTSVRFFNAYGLTETTVCATNYEVSGISNNKDLNREVPIGRNIDGVCVYILDNFMHLVPPNVVGEIYIGGIALCHGYIGHAREGNSKKFIRNPLATEPEMLYKTGDHAYQDQFGNITFVGRLDDVIKLRGQRIDLGEVEHVMGTLDGVDLAVVVPHTCSRSSEISVAAYISPKSLCRQRLKESLINVLPSYMIPTYIVKRDVNEYPKTQNGKIDRRKLQKDETVHQMSRGSCEIKMTEKQKIVSEIFGKVLKLESEQISRLDKDSSFQELGGSSLHLVMLQNEIDDQINIRLSFLEILTADTIEELASLISAT